jgi:DUF1016 N-terminal domain
MNDNLQHISFSILHETIRQARHNALKSVNAELVNLYWQVGAFVSKQLAQSQWGDKTVQQLADFLQKHEPSLKGFDRKSIYRMVQFYEIYRSAAIVANVGQELQNPENQSTEIVATVWRQSEYDVEKENVAIVWRQIKGENIRQTLLVRVNWSIHKILIGRTKTEEEREFYMRMCLKENYSVRELDRQISAGIFERVMIGNQKLSPALREKHPDIFNNFKDSYVFEFLNLSDIL